MAAALARRSRILLLLGSAGFAACGAPKADVGELASVRLDSLPRGIARIDSARGELILELPAIDIPAQSGEHVGMIVTPAVRVDIPASGFANSVRTELVDIDGKPVSLEKVHHVNVIDPQRRELFAPISLRLYASGKESEPASFPKQLLGLPLQKGQVIILKAMLHNSDSVMTRGVRARVVMGYSGGGAMWPVHQVYPMQLDVMFPLGDKDGEKSFDLPPGKFERKYSAKPAVSGKLAAMGGHFHDLAKFIEFKDVTANKVIFRGEPNFDSAGELRSIPVSRFYKWYSMGPELEADHEYEVRVVYENPTADTIRFGGMGIVGGVFVPNRGERWPTVDTTNVAYRTDLRYQLQDGNSIGEMAMMHEHHTVSKAYAAPAAHSHKH